MNKMKLITLLLYIVALQQFSKAQSAPVNATTLGYEVSDKWDYLRARYTPSNKEKEIKITSLPASQGAMMTVNMNIETTGTFTFKKDNSLNIPFSCLVFIEDKLTGRTFNLENASIYTFEVSQASPDRFRVHVLNTADPSTALTVK